MDIISAILGALLVGAGSYFGFFLTDRFDILKKGEGKWYLNKRYLIPILLSMAVWIAATLLHIRTMPLVISDALLLVFMTVLAVVDKAELRVPNSILKIMLILWVAVIAIYIILEVQNGLLLFMESLAGAIFAGIIFLLCYIITHKQIGGGDVKLSFLMGLYLTGGRVMGAIFYGIGCCCVFSIVQLCRKKLGMHDGIPLIPFLYIGVLITFLIIG